MKGRYSPAQIVAAERKRIEGRPDPAHISTSIVERHNLSIRMALRRFTHLINAFSKKLKNHSRALALYFIHYNFIRIHRALKIKPDGSRPGRYRLGLGGRCETDERNDAAASPARPVSEALEICYPDIMEKTLDNYDSGRLEADFDRMAFEDDDAEAREILASLASPSTSCATTRRSAM